MACAKSRHVLCHVAYFNFSVCFLGASLRFLIGVMTWGLRFGTKFKILPSSIFFCLPFFFFVLCFSCFTLNKSLNAVVSIMWQSGRNFSTSQSFSGIAVHNSTPKQLMFPFQTNKSARASRLCWCGVTEAGVILGWFKRPEHNITFIYIKVYILKKVA